MTPLLGNLLKPEHPFGGPGSPAGLIGLLAVVVMLSTAFIVWRRQMRALREPDSAALLKLLGADLGLTRPQRRLMGRMGRAAGLEPAAALLSAPLFTYLCLRAEGAGLTLTPQETAHLDGVRHTVGAAADASSVAAGDEGTRTSPRRAASLPSQ